MAESTYYIDNSDLRSAAMHVLRMTGAYSDLSAGDAAKVDQSIEVGGRLLLTPEPTEIPGLGVVPSHQWSWLKPTASLIVWPTQEPASGATITTAGTTTVTSSGSTWYSPSMIGKSLVAYTDDSNETLVGTVGTIASISGSTVTLVANAAVANDTYRWGIEANGAYRLPDNFGGIEGQELAFTAGSNQWFGIPVVSEAQIREAQGAVERTGRPLWAATRPQSHSQTAGQRWEILVYPTPEQVYTLEVPYLAIPDAVSASLTYPGGGALVGELWRAAVMAAAEREFLDERASHYQTLFARRLAAAIAQDLRLHSNRRGRSPSKMNPNQPIDRYWLHQSRQTYGTFVP